MNAINAVIFDLDGVIVSTDEFHYQGWKRVADEEGIFFDRKINDRLRGVSRMESLAIMLERAARAYTQAEKIALAERKNAYYRELLVQLSERDILPGVLYLCGALRALGVKLGIGSSSKNTPVILRQIGLGNFFDTVADGNDITRSKPDPEVFLLAANRLGVPPARALVVEDAESGVAAALAGGFWCLGVGAASHDARAHVRAQDLRQVRAENLIQIAA